MPVRSGRDATLNFDKVQKRWTDFDNSVAMGYRGTEQKIPNSGFTVIKIDKVTQDPGRNLDLVNGWYTVPSDGYYHVDGEISWAITSVVGAVFLASVGVNGSERARGTRVQHEAAAGAETDSIVSAIVFCNKGDHIELLGFQNTGVELGIVTVTTSENYLHIVKVA